MKLLFYCDQNAGNQNKLPVSATHSYLWDKLHVDIWVSKNNDHLDNKVPENKQKPNCIKQGT